MFWQGLERPSVTYVATVPRSKSMLKLVGPVGILAWESTGVFNPVDDNRSGPVILSSSIWSKVFPVIFSKAQPSSMKAWLEYAPLAPGGEVKPSANNLSKNS